MKNPNCPACTAGRRHTVAEFKQFHPMAGEGFIEGQGWSHPDLIPQAAKDPAGADLAQRRAEESRAVPQASAPAGAEGERGK